MRYLLCVLCVGCATSSQLLARGDLDGAAAQLARERPLKFTDEVELAEGVLNQLELEWRSGLRAVPPELAALDAGALFVIKPELRPASRWTAGERLRAGFTRLGPDTFIELEARSLGSTDGGTVSTHASFVEAGLLTPPQRPRLVTEAKYSPLEQWLLGAGLLTGIIPAVAVVAPPGSNVAGKALDAAMSNERVLTATSKAEQERWEAELKVWSAQPGTARLLELQEQFTAESLRLARPAEVSGVFGSARLSYHAEPNVIHELRALFTKVHASALAPSLEVFVSLSLELPQALPLAEVVTRPVQRLRFRCADPNPRPYDDMRAEYEASRSLDPNSPKAPRPDRTVHCVASLAP